MKLRSRRNVNSTPRSTKSPGDCNCYTDPQPTRTRSRMERDSFSPRRHLPSHLSPIRSTDGSSVPLSFERRSDIVAKQLSFVSDHPWTPHTLYGAAAGSPPSGGAPRSMNVTASSGPICRICHEGEQAGTLSSFCSCSGTMGLMHVFCLQRWLSTSNNDVCELCHDRFPTTLTRRTLMEWIRGHEEHRRALIGDLLCLLLLSPIAILGLDLCVQGASNQVYERRSWQAGSLVLLSCLMLSAFAVWSYHTTKQHYRNFREWQENNMKVVLVTVVPDEVTTRVDLSGACT